MSLDKIYIVHFEPLKERREFLTNALKKINYPYKFIINNLESDLKTYKEVDYYYKGNKKPSIGEYCAGISHYNIYKDIIDNDYDTCLIIEDDAVFCEDFDLILKQVLLESKQYDFSFLSSCCNLHTEKTSEKWLYEVNSSRSVCGYIVNNSDNFKNLVFNFFPMTEVIDWYLYYIQAKFNLKYAWCEPPIITQGSETIYKSNLR